VTEDGGTGEHVGGRAIRTAVQDHQVGARPAVEIAPRQQAHVLAGGGEPQDAVGPGQGDAAGHGPDVVGLTVAVGVHAGAGPGLQEVGDPQGSGHDAVGR
jgi:hypothetical protein